MPKSYTTPFDNWSFVVRVRLVSYRKPGQQNCEVRKAEPFSWWSASNEYVVEKLRGTKRLISPVSQVVQTGNNLNVGLGG